MAEITRGTVSLATVEPGYEHQINGDLAGETLFKGDFVYIKASRWRVSGKRPALRRTKRREPAAWC
jgi:hypothetical protein